MSQADSKPAYSIIIPTCNHPDTLRQCLTHLNNTEPPKRNWEVLIIDNSENTFLTDNKAVVQSFGNVRFIYHEMPPLGLMAARHKGAELAEGDVICFIDDDSLVDTSWLRGIEESFEDQKVVLVTGPIRGKFDSPPPIWLESLWNQSENGPFCAYLSLLDFGTEYQDIDPLFVWGCNYAIRRELFCAVRGSHPDYLPSRWWMYQGDGECGLSIKVKAFGYNARYSPKCSIKHLVPASRLTFEYLGNRAFFVGVHTSFTDIRRKHGLGASEGVPPPSKRTFLNKIVSKLRQYSDDLQRVVQYRHQLITVWQLRNHLKKRFREGYRSHQSQVKHCPQLSAYVARRDYFGENAVIPEENFCPQ